MLNQVSHRNPNVSPAGRVVGDSPQGGGAAAEPHPPPRAAREGVRRGDEARAL